jgi:arylsulfatase A-like enzyme
LVDVTPTILELAGLEPPGGLDGVSMAGVLLGRGDTPVERTRVAQEHAFSWGDRGRREEGPSDDTALGVAVLRGGQWYIGERGGEWLYDMRSDAEQRHDRSAGAPETLEALRAEAERHRGPAVGRPLLALPAPHRQRQLEALGYGH